jgi:hypothetical protein
LPDSLEFEVTFHEVERILEVRYPSRPTLESFGRYELAVRELISSFAAPWHCLADQSSLALLPPELPARIVELNTWARSRGMARTARVVRPSATAQLQVARILKQSGPGLVGMQCASRDEAWATLSSKK